MAPELVILVTLAGAVVCWAAVAAPELPALRRSLSVRLRRWFRVERVAADLAQAELHWLPPGRWITARWVLAAIAGIAGHLMLGLVVIGAVAALAAYHLSALLLEARRRRVEARRQRALLDAIRFGASVMSRSGGALQMVRALADSGPVDGQRMFQEILAEAGSDVPGLLVGAVERKRAQLADPLFDDIALALTLHWTHGGRLAPALEALAASWEESLRLKSEARALRAGVEASVGLLTLLPFVFLFLVHVLAPSLLAPLEQPVGEIVLALAVGWMVIGYRVIQWLSEAPREERLAVEEVVL